MKANRAQIERALASPPADIRLYLLYGPDEAGSRALAERIDRAMGADAERIDLDSTGLKADPARLADEAASISLFGGARQIRVSVTNADDALPAVEALMSANVAGNPVVAVAGALRATNALVKLALAHPAVMATISYMPDAEGGERMAAALAREAGLRLSSAAVARRLATAAGNDRAVLTREIEKYALFLDAAPDRPAELGDAAIDALGADAGDGDLARLTDAVLGGDPGHAAGELARLASVGIDGIGLLRPLLKRLQLLVQLRGSIDEGRSADAAIKAAGKAVFYKEEGSVKRALSRWTSPRLATAMTRLLNAERDVKAAGSLGVVAVDAALIAIARAAARGR